MLEEPREDGSIIFVSGDGRDKAYVWSVEKMDLNQQVEENKDNTPNRTFRSLKIHELIGHTETVEFCKFDSSGKWMATAGMNN